MYEYLATQKYTQINSYPTQNNKQRTQRYPTHLRPWKVRTSQNTRLPKLSTSRTDTRTLTFKYFHL